MGFSGDASRKEPTCLTGRHKGHRFDPWVENPMDRGAWQDTVHSIAKSPRVHTWTFFLYIPFPKIC